MAHIKHINFAHVGRNEGCLCDKCGQYIQNIVYVDYDDGIFAKLYNGGKLSTYGVKLMKKALKAIEAHSKQLLFPGENRKYTCGKCTEHCNKVCPLGKSGSVQGWHFEPCLSCKSNPYKIYNAETGGRPVVWEWPPMPDDGRPKKGRCFA